MVTRKSRSLNGIYLLLLSAYFINLTQQCLKWSCHGECGRGLADETTPILPTSTAPWTTYRVTNEISPHTPISYITNMTPGTSYNETAEDVESKNILPQLRF